MKRGVGRRCVRRVSATAQTTSPRNRPALDAADLCTQVEPDQKRTVALARAQVRFLADETTEVSHDC